jgi:hypothetical protein
VVVPASGPAPPHTSPFVSVSGAAVASASASASAIDVVSARELDEVEIAPLDLWSKAYREAVQSMGQDVDVAVLKGENIAQLFKEPEEVDKDATNESAFLRGVRYLSSIQVPLERFKLALDLTEPLTALGPTTSAVFGIVRGVNGK